MRRFALLALLPVLLWPTPAPAVTLHFTFGLTREAESCWEDRDRLKYRVDGQTYEVAKAEVARMERGECAPSAGGFSRFEANPLAASRIRRACTAGVVGRGR